jgi:hypothetical protein
MEPQLAVDEKNNLVEVQGPKKKYSRFLRFSASLISYLFHPIFIPVYLALLVLKTQSYLFAVFTSWEKTLLVTRFGIMYVMFPLVSVVLMKALGFVSSIKLKTQRDRIIPYVVCMVYYWWMWYVLHNQPEYPGILVILSLAIFLSSIGGLMANIRMKVSLHAIGAGIMLAFVMLLGLGQDVEFGSYISGAILLVGMICTARFIDGNHSAGEIYWGLFIGILSLVVAAQFSS